MKLPPIFTKEDADRFHRKRTPSELTEVERRTLEKDVESYGYTQAVKAGWRCRKFKSPLSRGEPDRIHFAPSGGYCFLIEYKRPGKTLTPKQAKTQRDYLDAGIHCYVCDCKKQAKAIIAFETEWYEKYIKPGANV